MSGTTSAEVNGRYEPSCIPAGVLWSCLTQDRGASIAIIDTDGRVHYANPVFEQIVKRPPGAAAGARLEEFFSRDFTESELRLIRSVCDTGRTVARLDFIRGTLRRRVFTPLPPQDECPACVLLVSRQAVSEEGEAITPSTLTPGERADKLGALAVLSPREIEVLAMIGRGMRSKEIAGVLHRSIRTVHGHTAAISRKLGGISRAEMVRLALASGLPVQTGRSPSR